MNEYKHIQIEKIKSKIEDSKENIYNEKTIRYFTC